MGQSFMPSSFGADMTTMGPPSFRARSIVNSQRYRELDRIQQYYDCTQHDFKRFDFDGRMIPAGPAASAQVGLSSAEPTSFYVPIKLRRPSSPYRLGRIIVNAFTNMIFGESRWPDIQVEGDEDAEDFCKALIEAADLETRMTQARNLGGSMGTVGLSWRYVNGKPRVEVHNAKHLYVHEWEDREELIPAYVVEIYRYHKDEWDEQKKGFVRNWYWFRRDWTSQGDIQYHHVLVRGDNDPAWEIDEENSVDHDDGFCHFVWVQNIPSENVDGVSDYHGQLDQFDTIDVLHSVMARGTILNLDPTVVLKMDPTYVQKVGVKKGSDNALVVGETGDANYLEMAGGALQVAIELFNLQRRASLEATECVVPDPSEIVASGMSSVAMRVVYLPMLSKCQVLRKQYGKALTRILNQMLHVARMRMGEMLIQVNETGEEEQVQQVIDLPPRVEKLPPQLDPMTGKPALDPMTNLPFPIETVEIRREPGTGGTIELVWGEYFPATPDDLNKLVQTLSLATAGKAFVSKKTAIELFARAANRNPQEEEKRVEEGARQQAAEQAQMFPGGGGEVDEPDQLPPGAPGQVPKVGGGGGFGGGHH